MALPVAGPSAEVVLSLALRVSLLLVLSTKMLVVGKRLLLVFRYGLVAEGEWPDAPELTQVQ